jgi:hypothetical protein
MRGQRSLCGRLDIGWCVCWCLCVDLCFLGGALLLRLPGSRLCVTSNDDGGNPCQGSAYGSVEDSNSPPVGPLSGGREETKMPAPAARGEPSGALAAQVWRASVSPGVRTRHSHCGVCSPGSVGIVLLVVTNQIAPHVATKSCHEVFEPLRCRLQRPDPTMTHAITAHTTLQEFHHQSP